MNYRDLVYVKYSYDKLSGVYVRLKFRDVLSRFQSTFLLYSQVNEMASILRNIVWYS